MPKPKRYTAKGLANLMKGHGWTQGTGGKHQILMQKAGERPITIPLCGGETLSVGLSQGILKQAGIDVD